MHAELDFGLPQPTKEPGNGSPFLSREAFEAWFQHFKVTTPEQTAHDISSTLEKMNATIMQVDDRLYALSRLFGYATLTAELFSEHSAPSSEDLFMQLANQQSVLDIFGQGCCLVVQDLLRDDQKSNAAKAKLARAIHLAISSYSQLMVEGYASHYVGADGSWRYVNRLYLLAEQLGLAQQEALHHSSIQHSYLRIAILSLSNPFHLMPGEARMLYKKLDDWVQDVQLISDRAVSISGKPFVDLATTHPPMHLRKEVGWEQLKPSEGRLINMDNLIRTLDQLVRSMLISHHRDSQFSSMNQRIQRDFFVRLRDAWSERKERQSQRQECWQEIEVATGLSAVHYYMRESNGEDLSEFLGQDAYQGDILTDTHFPKNDYVEDARPISQGVWSRIDVQENPFQEASQHAAFDKYPLNTWLQCDISEGGLAVCHARDRMRFSGSGEVTESGASFSLPRAASANVKVGDLIAYRNRETEAGRWEVGTIRWMRLDRRTGVKFGIMRISREAEAAKVRAINGVGAGSAHGDALLVEHNDLFGGAIITPAAIYDIGTRLELAQERLEHKLITLSRQILSSAKFSLFEFQAV